MSQTSHRPAPGKPEALTGRARTIALIVAATFFMQLLDSTIIVTSLPQIAQSFGVEPVALGIGITIYMLVMAVFIPPSGWLADRFGARTIFALAILIFTLASLWVGASSSLFEFVAARALQGLGGALMTPVGRILVLRSARKSQLLPAIALISWPALFAPVLGPVVGGFITTYLSWRWNFFINVPLGLIGIWLVLRLIPDVREDGLRRFDVKGFVLTALGAGTLLLGLEAGVHGLLPTPWVVLLLAVGTGAAIAAIRHLSADASPLIDLAPFRHLTFRISNISAGILFRTAIAATPFLLPLFFQSVFAMTPLEAGGYLLIYFLGNLVMKTVTTPVIARFGFRTVLFVNGLLCATFLFAFAFIDTGTPVAGIFIVLAAAGLTRSMQFTGLNTLGFADIDAAMRSSAATASAMLQQIAMAVGVAIGAAILSLSAQIRGDGSVALADFKAAFVAIAALSLIGAIRMAFLPEDAGEAVSGRSTRPAAS